MTQYRTRPGVVLTAVCGEHLLVATRSARGKVPYIRMINEAAAYLWPMLAQQDSPDEILRRICADYDIPAEQARTALQAFVDSMVQAGYLLPADVAL